MNFVRINITAEGPTEEHFVKSTLSLYLGKNNISTDVRNVKTSKDKFKTHRGGLINYPKAKNDIGLWMREDDHREAYFTTMFDLYGLPNDFPGFEESKKIYDPYERVSFLEERFKEDIDHPRFIPYIQLFEFEALILSKPEVLIDEYFDREDEIQNLINQVKEKGNPELINDNIETAPSKRILKLIPEYNKVSVGSYIAGAIGMEWLLKECQHFNSWISDLEKLTS